jgi:hypothetical protein
MTYGTFPGPIFDVKSGYEVRISIYHLCHMLYSDFCDNGIIYCQRLIQLWLRSRLRRNANSNSSVMSQEGELDQVY